MKSLMNDKYYLLLFLMLNFGLVSCDGGNTGNKDTQIDSTKLYDEYAIDQSIILDVEEDSDNYLADVTTRNAVKVNIALNGFNWDSFRELYHNPGDFPVGIDVTDEAALGSWAQWGDEYSYQLVYRNFNNDLWIQTYYRNDDEQGRANVNTDINVLTIQASDSLKLSQLWLNMERLAITLRDSINTAN